ncbi:hypothetical protein Pla123a_28890 [Posidoniimonas polymericola]|uniref:Uncharacterized protein n=1 Tax=Posidoniimonas polymericola TaxID=2528002 RepID=A0A5C5YMP1_9BACT|nr:hypothetical protein [Posidoniimonas polymericola]TWT76100.1 hypothetical protein Pla123a_28890 [Posidoniimonas polymericola]
MASPTAYAAETSAIVPGVLYTLTGFIRVSGISKSRISSERLDGNVLATVKAGRRVYVRGEDGIAFIERIAAQHAAS